MYQNNIHRLLTTYRALGSMALSAITVECERFIYLYLSFLPSKMPIYRKCCHKERLQSIQRKGFFQVPPKIGFWESYNTHSKRTCSQLVEHTKEKIGKLPKNIMRKCERITDSGIFSGEAYDHKYSFTRGISPNSNFRN